MSALQTRAAVPDLQWVSLDGVNAIWVESGGPFAAGICFRVGRVDEPLPNTGITHLAEHLALNRFGPHTYHQNGAVDGAYTTFHAAGDEEEASDFVQHVIRNAARFDAARLGSEAKLVDAEAQGVRPSVESRLLWARFGATGFGLLNSPEFAPRLVDPSDVAAWAEHHFVRNNAVFWFTGKPPGWLEVPLPDGEWQLPPVVEPLPWAQQPSVTLSGQGVVAISFLMPRTAAADVAIRLLEQRVVTLLRDQRAVTSQISRNKVALNADTWHITLSALCADQHAALAGRLLLDAMESLIRPGLMQAEIDAASAAMAAEQVSVAGMLDLVRAEAERLLLGGQPKSPDETRAEWAALGASQVSAELASATNSVLMLLPESVRWNDGRLPLMHRGRDISVEGRQFRLRGDVAQKDGPTELTIGADGISSVCGKDSLRTVLFDACVGLLYGGDGIRVVIGRDGTSIRVATADWKDGKVIADYLDGVIPAQLRIPLDVRA